MPPVKNPNTGQDREHLPIRVRQVTGHRYNRNRAYVHNHERPAPAKALGERAEAEQSQPKAGRFDDPVRELALGRRG